MPPNGELKEKISKAVNSDRETEKIMVIENAGAPITTGLREKDPFRQEGCAFNEEIEGCAFQ